MKKIKVIEMRNGIAKVCWRIGSDPAYLENEYLRAGDWIDADTPGLQYNGPSAAYDELQNRFDA